MAANGTFRPGTALFPATQVELTISCRNLKDMDVFSVSDPLCVLYAKDFTRDRYREYGRTESISNTLNPNFVKKFLIDYCFEEQQKLRFEIYDKDAPGMELDRHDFLGCLNCTLGEIVGAQGSRCERKLKGEYESRNYGSIIIQSEELKDCKMVLLMRMRADNLDRKNWFGKSDPFLVFHRCNEDGSSIIVHKTEVIKNTLDPEWKPFVLKLRTLCNGDYDRPILVDCFDWNPLGSHVLIGVFVTDARTLIKGACEENIYEVIHAKKQARKKQYQNSGTVTVLSAEIDTEYSFLDYIQAGLQIHFTVAIDFTKSNGQTFRDDSLHYVNTRRSSYPINSKPNEYLTALQAVGEIIQDYDSTKTFPALGFGARIPPDWKVSHDFFLNINSISPYCDGIEGVIDAYKNAIKQVKLAGPTYFCPVINYAASIAEAQQSGSDYFILLILTDGEINDLNQTKQAIIAASKLPLSIIIIGVGDADFDNMDELDSDGKLLKYYDEVAERDIVQFVPMRYFKKMNYADRTISLQKAQLAKHVLAEVPEQVIKYMRKIEVNPPDLANYRAPSAPSEIEDRVPAPFPPMDIVDELPESENEDFENPYNEDEEDDLGSQDAPPSYDEVMDQDYSSQGACGYTPPPEEAPPPYDEAYGNDSKA